MRLMNKSRRTAAILLSALLGAVAFILIYGYRVLIPTYADWMMLGGGDPQQHYLGWRFFQQSSWYFPIGMMDNLGYPIMTSVVFTDSIPLFAVIFKLLTPLLPANFQYFGIWGILCFMPQGALGALICLRYARSPVQAVLGSLLFILSPPILHRMFYHTTLAGHWIILLGLTLVVYHQFLAKRPALAILLWGLLGGLIASIHLYFLPMCGILCIGYCAYDIIRNKRWYGFLPVVSFVACALVIGWVFGTFTSSAGEYKVRITGRNLDVAELDCLAEDVAFDLLDLRVTDVEVTYRVQVAERTNRLETRVRNPSDEVVTLMTLTIESITP